MDKFISIGLMSGTSMDGVDGAAIETDGCDFIRFIGAAKLRYPGEAQFCFKGLEALVRSCQGDTKRAEEEFGESYQDVLVAFCGQERAQSALSWLSKEVGEVSYRKVIELSTNYHLSVARDLLSSLALPASDVYCVGYHGQTLFHRPAAGITIQVGDAQRMADELGIDVVFDFRKNDVAHGGQGAPFAPLYHRLLAKTAGILPCVFANCGGVSNLTILGQGDDEIIGYDAGPGNALIDDLVKKTTNGTESCDRDGRYGQQGQVDERVLEMLCDHAVTVEGKNYLKIIGPKSLDVADASLIPEVLKLSLNDGCRTLEAFTAEAIVRSVEQLGISIPIDWVLHGGGWNNPIILAELQARLNKRTCKSVTMKTADQVGLRSESLEAEIFAYLAVRSRLGLPLSVPGSTGVSHPTTGGVLFKAKGLAA